MKVFRCKRQIIGSSLVELAVSLAVMPIIGVFFLDCAKLVIGAQINDNTCREAARIAATGDPGSAALRAESIVYKAGKETTGMISNLRLVSVVNTMNGCCDPTTIQLNGGNVTGTVIVTTAADIRPFLGHWLAFSQEILTLKSQQSFPYTYVVPTTAPTNQ